MFETIPYLEWIDGRIESARYDLASSNLCTSHNGIVSESDIYSAADVSELIADEYGVRPENVLLTAGTGHANFVVAATIATMCEHWSDKMDYLVETPSYQSLTRTPRSLGANVARFERRATNEHRLNLTTIEDTISPATDIIVVTNRHNPSGQLTDVNKLAALAELASDKDTLLLIDEAYASYGRSPTEGPFGGPSAAGFSDTIVISSITKFFNLYDLRIGPPRPELIKPLRNSLPTSC
jgi:aspartate/methionine/tyrosine aminotransferase